VQVCANVKEKSEGNLNIDGIGKRPKWKWDVYSRQPNRAIGILPKGSLWDYGKVGRRPGSHESGIVLQCNPKLFVNILTGSRFSAFIRYRFTTIDTGPVK